MPPSLIATSPLQSASAFRAADLGTREPLLYLAGMPGNFALRLVRPGMAAAHREHKAQLEALQRQLVYTRDASSYQYDPYLAHQLQLEVALLRRSAPPFAEQRSYPTRDLPWVLADLDPGTETYITQATFWERNRQVKHLAYLPASFIDLDLHRADPENDFAHLAEAEPAKVVGALRWYCAEHSIPCPSLVVSSGGGLHLKWLFQQPLPAAALERWDAVQRALVALFRPWNADAKARDAARVLRVPGTLHAKSGRQCTVIHAEGDAANPLRHSFDFLAETVVQYPRNEAKAMGAKAKAKGARQRQATARAAQGKPRATAVPSAQAWPKACCADLDKLAKLRRWDTQGVPRGSRTAFLYHRLSFGFLAGEFPARSFKQEATRLVATYCPEYQRVLSRLSTLHGKIARPLGRASSVNGFGPECSKIPTPRAQTLIGIFRIKEEEMTLGNLTSLLSPRLKLARRARQKRARRHAQGGVSREQYLRTQKEATDALREQAILLRSQGLRQKDIAARLGRSPARISQLLKGAVIDRPTPPSTARDDVVSSASPESSLPPTEPSDTASPQGELSNPTWPAQKAVRTSGSISLVPVPLRNPTNPLSGHKHGVRGNTQARAPPLGANTATLHSDGRTLKG